jgi:hypothetical protein
MEVSAWWADMKRWNDMWIQGKPGAALPGLGSAEPGR